VVLWSTSWFGLEAWAWRPPVISTPWRGKLTDALGERVRVLERVKFAFVELTLSMYVQTSSSAPCANYWCKYGGTGIRTSSPLWKTRAIWWFCLPGWGWDGMGWDGMRMRMRRDESGRSTSELICEAPTALWTHHASLVVNESSCDYWQNTNGGVSPWWRMEGQRTRGLIQLPGWAEVNFSSETRNELDSHRDRGRSSISICRCRALTWFPYQHETRGVCSSSVPPALLGLCVSSLLTSEAMWGAILYRPPPPTLILLLLFVPHCLPVRVP